MLSEDPAEGTRYQWVEAFTVSTWPVWVAVVMLIVVWALAVVLSEGVDPLYRAWLWGAKVPALVAEGQWWRLSAASMLHLEVQHLALNLVGVYALGRLAVVLFGGQRMWAVLIITAVAGTVSSWLISPEWSLGASGGVFGLLGAVGAALIRHRQRVPADLRPMLRWRVVPWVILGCAVMITHGGNIDHAAHLGALAVGALAGLVMPVIPLGAARQTPVTRGALAVAVVIVLYGALGAWLHRQSVLETPTWSLRGNGGAPAAQIDIPEHWLSGEALDPSICAQGWTDGLLTLCAGRLPSVSGIAEARGRLVAYARSHGLKLVPEGEKATAGRGGGWVLDLEFAPAQGQGRIRAWLRADPQGVDVVMAALISPEAGARWQGVILERARTSFRADTP